ncbi:protein-disulfide reductase DsbD family protein [Rhodoferax sediminis]|uniref:Protein-disulfide reductase n=1 Tax=Rhodoferax sediminis TaxID=2509614 RepID=A0A515D6X7_9BURK|nr:thioredoxin family protein [Rhodoferax sediminis]QDL36151.1 protein-disulfide reductase [Rhodoferax sediminis]
MTAFQRFFRLLLAIIFIAGSALSTVAKAQIVSPTKAAAVVSTERVRAELMAQAPDGVVPGQSVWVGLQLAHQPHWHTYWKNAGDSGLPTQLQWTLPPGVTAGDIAWPVPQKISIGTLANYGYEGTVLLPVPLTIAPDFKPPLFASNLEVKLKASWLVCRTECIPEDGEFVLKIPLKGSTALNRAAFESALAAHPKPLVGDSRVEIAGDTLKVSVAGLPAAIRGKTLAFFPETPEVIETAAPFTQAWQGNVWTAQVPLSSQRSNSPAVMPVVLEYRSGDTVTGYRAEARVLGTWPKLAAAATVSPALDAALKANAGAGANPTGPAGSLSLVAALLGALLGGLLLNLMPCVFPVLAIKVIGFTRHAGDRRAHSISALAYTAGVLASFLALGALMLGLRAAGEQLGWGFQLQSPAVVAALAALFTVIGLNLAGLFEFGRFVPHRVVALEARNPAANAFLSGVLVVAIASPCTAPFMGASLGLAVGLPPAQALAVFGAIGFGMALPYLAAGLVPAVARLLPRPGAWMATFRHLMAFPMFATVAWLVWVLGQQSGIDGAGALLALLVALSAVLWAFTLAGRSRIVIATLSIAGFALLAAAIGPNITKPLESAPTVAAGARWQPWEPGRVDQIVARGQPVFVDFTAAWCVTCQYNRKTTLTNAAVLADLAAKNVVLLRADWTRRDPAISAAIGQLGRSGVPVYVMYKPGSAPQVLPEVLSVDEVRAAIARL